MTDESPDEAVAADDHTELSARERKLIKRYLKDVKDRRLYEFADPFLRESRGTGLNFLVGGTIVCGEVCTAKEWAEALNQIAETHAGQRSETFDDWSREFAELSEAHHAAFEKDDAELTDEDLDARWVVSDHIYLLNSYVIMNGSKVPSSGQPYKVRIDAIQAWGFGTVGPDQG